MKSPDAKPKPNREQALVLQILTAKARVREHAAKASAKSQELRALRPVGQRITLPDGRAFIFADNYAEKEVAFKTVGFDRYELRELKS